MPRPPIGIVRAVVVLEDIGNGGARLVAEKGFHGPIRRIGAGVEFAVQKYFAAWAD